MPGVPSHRTAVVLRWLVILCAVAALTSCASYRQKRRLLSDPDPGPCHANPGAPVPNPGNPGNPIVCIDDRDMDNVPYPGVVHAKRNAAINWFTVTGQGSLAIVFDDRSPVKHLVCGQNKAFCHAVIENDAEVGSYDYSAIVTRAGKKKWIDPTVQVDP